VRYSSIRWLHPKHPLIGMCVKRFGRRKKRSGLYCRVAALNLAISSAGTRPRFTSMPCACPARRAAPTYRRRLPKCNAPDPLGVPVDLILGAIQPKVVNEHGLYLPGHRVLHIPSLNP